MVERNERYLRRLGATLFLAAFALGCAATKGAEATGGSGNGSGPAEAKQKLANLGFFDLAVCFPTESAPTKVATQEGIIGFLVGARPQVLECLVDPANRGPEKSSRVVVDTTVNDAGVDHKVTGTNLTPQGTQCIHDALAKRPGLVALPKGQKAVTGHAEVTHLVGVSPAVTLGINESSDVVGKIRLAQTSWCDCYEAWKSQPPHLLKSKITVQKARPAPAAVAFDPPTSGDPTTDAVAACLQKKLLAMQLETKSDELVVPYPFIHLHSGVDADLPGAPADVNFLQWDSRRSQLASQTATALGNRVAAVTVYDALVARYKAKPDYALVKDLKKKCSALVEADTTWIAALEKQLTVDQKTLASIQAAGGSKDEQWQQSEKAAQATVAATQKELDGAKKVRTDDQGACPKERYN